MYGHSLLNVPTRSAVSLAFFVGAALAQAPLYDVPGALGEQVGRDVAAVGDVDGDGFDDFAVGASSAPGLQPGAGRVAVMSGRTGGVVLNVLGERTGDLFGWSVAALGDITLDGVPDLIVGAPRHEWTSSAVDRGAVYTFSGANGAQIWKLGGNADFDQLGWAVAGPGDVDQDGVPDYAMSKPWGDLVAGPQDIGFVWIHSGANHTALRLYLGEKPGDAFGYSLDAAGDLDGDARPDLLAGAPFYDAGNFLDAGRGYVLSGAQSGQVLWTKTGSYFAGHFGHSVAGVPRVDGDAVNEVAFGEPHADTAGIDSGRVRVYSGATQGLLRDFVGSAGDRLGWAVAGLVDFDLDGRGDVVLGVPGRDIGASIDSGEAVVRSVDTGALLASTLGGYHPGEEMGQSVSSAGDLNADGASDVLAGSPFFDGNFPDGGRVRVVLGSAPVPTTYCTAKVNSAGCTPSIGFTGCASVSVGDNFRVHALNVLLGKTGLMLWSLQADAVPFQGGTLCVGSPIVRTPAQTSYDDPYSSHPCPGAYDFHFSHATMAANALTPGTHVFAQYWSRDPGFAAPDNVGLTNGIDFVLLP